MIFKTNGIVIKFTPTQFHTGRQFTDAQIALFERLVSTVFEAQATARVDAAKRIIWDGGLLYVKSYPDPEKKIQAIKICREITGLGLAEAKAFVEGKAETLTALTLDRLQDLGWTFSRTAW